MRKYNHDRLLVVDIETVLDDRLAPRDHPRGEFAKPSWHRVVAISFVEARIERSAGSEAFLIEDCRSGGESAFDEGRLVAGFWKFFARRTPRLVTWNGRAHDMAVLVIRGMMSGIDLSCWSATYDGHGYRFRYASDFHCDLQDQLADYGSSIRLSLQDAAEAFKLPGKIVDGPGTVESLYRAGKIEQIRAYCEGDALNTFGVYLHWSHATGLSSDADFRRSVAAFRTHLESRRADRPHLGIFLDRWPDPATVGGESQPAAVRRDAGRGNAPDTQGQSRAPSSGRPQHRGRLHERRRKIPGYADPAPRPAAGSS